MRENVKLVCCNPVNIIFLLNFLFIFHFKEEIYDPLISKVWFPYENFTAAAFHFGLWISKVWTLIKLIAISKCNNPFTPFLCNSLIDVSFLTDKLEFEAGKSGWLVGLYCSTCQTKLLFYQQSIFCVL